MASENLGRVLMAQARYDEARKAFETAFNLAHDRSTGPSGLAEVRLRKGTETEEALEYAEQALQLYLRSKLEQRGARERLAAIRGNMAWAFAVLGRADEARKAINAARADLDPRHIPETAAFHWRAGIVMHLLADHGASETHFFRAIKRDPGGYYGKLAAHEAAKQPA
jgi:tetratricopeptide (TPR) repeat protein